jgi:hypothetical protein
MKNFKGTPGTWTVKNRQIISEQRLNGSFDFDAFIAGSTYDKRFENALSQHLSAHVLQNDLEESDLKIMAAAPDLLKALIHMTEMCEKHLNFKSQTAEWAISKALD